MSKKLHPTEVKQARVSGVHLEWQAGDGTFSFEHLPVAMMWVDTTLAGLMAGLQAMVGTERFGLALQSEGRKSVEADWQVISRVSDFPRMFEEMARIAAVAGWGSWELLSLDEARKTCRFLVRHSWEGRYQRALGVCWGSAMLGGKLAGLCSKLFKTNCWAEQTMFLARGEEHDEFVVAPSARSIENEIDALLESDEATRADMAVALEKLRTEIAGRKRAEEELQAANTRLVGEDLRKNEFLALLSHELRNPLAPIRNGLYILDRAVPDGEQWRRAKAVIDRQVSHMVRLIDDLLDITRITRGKIQLQREPLELNELAQRTVEDHHSVFVKGEVQVEVLPAAGAVWVSGDRIRLSQVLGNLLQNAAKFTPRNAKATVTIEADAARGQATIRVRDTGAGIAPEIMPRLFDTFTQADVTLDRSKGGLGLGLALVKGLVEMHGGSVRGESDGVGKGATFTITLPLATSTAPAKDVRQGAPGKGAPRRVLVIEDNIDSADSLREALELGGDVVEVAYSGPEGLEKARAFMPEVVLCDIGLPGMDGYAVAQAMRADSALGHVSLVALTGYARPEDIARAKESGFDAHLAKPPSMEAIERVLDDAQSRTRDSRPSA